MGLSDYDREHIGDLVNGRGDWFTAQLVYLIGKADLVNREKIRKGFPEEVAAYEAWNNAEPR